MGEAQTDGRQLRGPPVLVRARGRGTPLATADADRLTVEARDSEQATDPVDEPKDEPKDEPMDEPKDQKVDEEER